MKGEGSRGYSYNKYLKEDGCCMHSSANNILCDVFSAFLDSYVTRSVNWSSAAVVVVVCGGSAAVKRSTSPLPLVVTALLLVMLAGLAMVAAMVLVVVGAVSGKLLPVISVLSCALALSRNRSRQASERSLLDS